MLAAILQKIAASIFSYFFILSCIHLQCEHFFLSPKTRLGKGSFIGKKYYLCIHEKMGSIEYRVSGGYHGEF